MEDRSSSTMHSYLVVGDRAENRCSATRWPKNSRRADASSSQSTKSMIWGLFRVIALQKVARGSWQ